MLRVIVSLFIFTATLVGTQEILDFSYYFGLDFFKSFNDASCENNTWKLITYESIDVLPPYKESSHAIQAEIDSCTSSFPIILFPGSILEISVYVQVISEDSGLEVTVFDVEDGPLVYYKYYKNSKGFQPGWNKILLSIENQTTGYINLRGHSLEEEVVLIDSFRYIPPKTKINKFDENIEDEKELIFYYDTDSIDEFDLDEAEFGNRDDGSGIEDDEEENEQPDPEESAEGNNGFWNLFTIVLVAVGSFTILGIVGVSAYFCGKNRGMINNPDMILEEDLEPPVVITIPRIRNFY